MAAWSDVNCAPYEIGPRETGAWFFLRGSQATKMMPISPQLVDVASWTQSDRRKVAASFRQQWRIQLAEIDWGFLGLSDEPLQPIV
jgi:hypothetical protein